MIFDFVLVTLNCSYNCVHAASDGSLWTPVVRPVSVPVVTQRASFPSSSDMRDTRTVPRQMPFESRRATSSYSLPRARSGVNGPSGVNGRALVDGRRSTSSSDARLQSGRPRSVENIDLRPIRQSPSQIPPVNNAGRLLATKSTDEYRRSLPMSHVAPVTSPSTWSAPAEWSYEQRNESLPQLDRYRSRSLSADRRKYFPPLQQDASLQRDERGQQLENTRQEVR